MKVPNLLVKSTVLLSLALTLSLASAVLAAPPVPGDVIINEYSSDNDASGSDYVELLVLTDNVDLRGLRISDNEIVGGVLNTNESVLVFGQDSFLSSVPKGTTIAVYTIATGVTVDTVTNAAAGDWKLVLAPGTGITTSIDGLGGSLNTGLSTGGEALYLYFTGPDNSSASTDNIYLDFMSFEGDGGDPPAGFTDINLPSVSDNAYYTGNTALDNDTAGNWVAYDGIPNALATPGEANPSQNLSGLRTTVVVTGPAITTQPMSGTITAGQTTTLNVVATGTAPLSYQWYQGTSGDISTPVGTNAPSFTTPVLTTTTSYWVRVSDSNGSIDSSTAIVTVTPISATLIHDIQGSGTTFDAAFGGTQTIEGIVVRSFAGSTKLNGFYVQEEDVDADSNVATSEGLFIFDPGGLFTGSQGDKVRVTGVVSEFTTSSSSLTQITVSSLSNLGTSTLPTVTPVQLPVANVSDLERYEGMLVAVSASTGNLTATEYFQLGRFGQILLSVTGTSDQPGTDARLDQFTQFNAPSVSGYANHLAEIARRQIYLDDGSNTQNPDPILFGRGGLPLSAANTLRGGDTVASITGILDQRFEGYRIQTSTGVDFQATNTRPATPPVVGGTLKVLSFNVLNYFNGDGTGGTPGFNTSEQRGADNLTEFNRQRDKTIQAIINSGADILGLIELENDGFGPTSAIQDLINGLNVVAGTGTYALIDPGTSMGTDAIKVAFIYKPSKASPVGAAAVIPNAFGTGAFDVVGRKPLAQTFQEITTGQQFTAVINHFKSKGSSSGGAGDSDALDGQSLSNGTRTRQAQDLASWLATKPTGTNDPDYLLLGDLNAYAKEDPLTTLAAAGYVSLVPDTSYSYVFSGQLGSLDHALANSTMAAQITGANKWHISSDEPTVLDYNTEFKTVGQVTSLYSPDQYRASDHDPVVVGLNLGQPTVTTLSPAAGPAGTLVTLTGTRFTGTTAVTFNGVAASFKVLSDTSITATAPLGATTGTVSITALTGTGTSGTFTVVTSPQFVNSLVIAGNATDLVPGSGANVNRLGGFFSDLFYDRTNNVYYGLSDRGPGGGTISYNTRVQKFTLDVDPSSGAISNLRLLSTIPLTSGGTPFNGFNPLNLNGDKSVLGLSLDPEGIVVGPNGHLFISDEYGPSVYEFDASGAFIRAFTVPANLVPKDSNSTVNYVDGRPTITAGRQDNRGFEGLTISPDGTKLYALLQDPLVNEGGSNDGRQSRNLRMVRYDIATGVSDAQYLYVLDDYLSLNNGLPTGATAFTATNQGRSIGISSITALSATEFLVIERDNRGLGVDAATYPNGTTNLVGSKRVFRVNLTGATDVTTVSLAGTNTLPNGTVPVSKSLYLDIRENLLKNNQPIPEKLEGLTVGPRLTDGSYALIIGSDNDYSVTQNGSNVQFDVCTDGTTATQVPLDTPCPTGSSLIPTYVLGFKTNLGELSFPTPPRAVKVAGWQMVGPAGDIDQDGQGDILWRNYTTGENAAWLMDGSTYRGAVFLPPLNDLSWTLAAAADFNSDGKPDLLWRNNLTGEIAFWLMDRNVYTYTVIVGTVVDVNWQIAGTADMNADGQTDILWRNYLTGDNAVWFMSGITYQSAYVFARVADLNWELVGGADLTGDSKPDLLWRNYATGQTNIWEMNGVTYVNNPLIGMRTGPSQWTGAQDFNANGRPDLLWRDPVTGVNEIWLMDGYTYQSTVTLPPVAPN